jgi:agmatinase
MTTKSTNSNFIAEMHKLENGLPASEGSGFLGANLSPDDCHLVLVGVPWEATTSYGGGTSEGPEAINNASRQLDLEDSSFGMAYRAGICFAPVDDTIVNLNHAAKQAASTVIRAVENGRQAPEELKFVNECSQKINDSVYEQSKKWLGLGKFVGVVGGDHSSPYGLLKALSEACKDKDWKDGFGILHFDAHHDLRNAYEGFQHSHASIFYNVMQDFPEVSKLVQVAIRDYSRDEKQYMDSLKQKGRGDCFYGRDIFKLKAEGTSFKGICREIINSLPKKVYVSFDIDALDPSYCPSTGTPVPGGLSYDEAVFILEELASSGRTIVGFDLCEVAPSGDDEWDANVGARLLYKLCGCLLRAGRLC